MKGIILAGGSGSRLYPSTKVTSKQLLPIYDKPMIYYPLSILMLAEIKDILIITTPQDKSKFELLLGDGSDFGIKLTYICQPSPDGLAQAFILGESFIGDDQVCLILGDNIFYGNGMKALLNKAKNNVYNGGATIFGYHVENPSRYGVVEFDDQGNVLSLVEKPTQPKSNYAITGLYFYDNTVVELAKKVKPSSRGELEITDLNKLYFDLKKLSVITLGRGYAWLDTGTQESLLEASQFVKIIEDHQGIKIACLEEISYINGWISREKLSEVAELMKNSDYGKYLKRVLEGRVMY